MSKIVTAVVTSVAFLSPRRCSSDLRLSADAIATLYAKTTHPPDHCPDYVHAAQIEVAKTCHHYCCTEDARYWK